MSRRFNLLCTEILFRIMMARAKRLYPFVLVPRDASDRVPQSNAGVPICLVLGCSEEAINATSRVHVSSLSDTKD